MSPIPQTSFLIGTFFAAACSKTAVENYGLLSSIISKNSQKEADEIWKVLQKSVQTDQDTDFIVFPWFSLAGTPNKVANCYQCSLLKMWEEYGYCLSFSLVAKTFTSKVYWTWFSQKNYPLVSNTVHSRFRKLHVFYRNKENKKIDFLFGLFQKNRCKTISCISGSQDCLLFSLPHFMAVGTKML